MSKEGHGNSNSLISDHRQGYAIQKSLF